MQLWTGCVKRRDQAAQGHDLAQTHGVDPDQLPLGPRLAVEVDAMRKSMVSSKDKLLEHLDRLEQAPDWDLPGELQERVAPHLMIKIFKFLANVYMRRL